MDPARLIYMANQIAKNFAVRGEAEAIQATAAHIKDFWNPAMRAQLIAAANGSSAASLDALAAKAVIVLESG
jgi:formate dehydrogenase subunit delta